MRTFSSVVGDMCDDDIDGDGVPNDEDNCPLVANKDQEPSDTSEVSDHDILVMLHLYIQRGAACENDYDGDGQEDGEDVCPGNPSITQTDFRDLETMDLCEKNDVESKTW